MTSCKFARATIVLLLVIVACSNTTLAQSKRIVIAVSTLFDGKGNVLRDTRIVIEGSKMVRIDPKANPVDYDLRGLTVMPGWIDAHTRLQAHAQRRDLRSYLSFANFLSASASRVTSLRSFAA